METKQIKTLEDLRKAADSKQAVTYMQGPQCVILPAGFLIHMQGGTIINILRRGCYLYQKAGYRAPWKKACGDCNEKQREPQANTCGDCEHLAGRLPTKDGKHTFGVCGKRHGQDVYELTTSETCNCFREDKPK